MFPPKLVGKKHPASAMALWADLQDSRIKVAELTQNLA
jgi:hypothetical protein